jgi:hypothetical protein
VIRSRLSRTRALWTAAAVFAATLAATVPVTQASEYAHPTVVSTDPVNWTPHLVEVTGQPKPVALSVAEAGNRMIVGGKFTTVEDGARRTQVSRSNVVAFSATTGAIDPGFAPQVNGQVWAVASAGPAVWIGGNFTTVNGTTRPAIAKLDLATGALDTTFQPPAVKGGRVTDLELSGGRLYAAGTFAKRLLALDPVTGATSPYLSTAVTGKLPNSDGGQVFKFDISPDGRRLVAVGNFTTVAGQDRPRVFMLDLGATAATLSTWNYDPLAVPCTSTRTNAIAYVQDVDFAPDSEWFALAAFGYMYQPGQRGLQLCDSVSRFETDVLDPSAPTWINYTGGDSLKSVAVTGAAVYVQGHSRWLDNPFGQDSAGPGAVSRPGGGAVDPTTGKALAWNPVMPQQSGGYQILPTATGVWFATDGSRFGGEYRRGIRFAPLP